MNKELIEKNWNNVPEEVKPLLKDFSESLQKILGENLYGIYIYGSLVFPEKMGLNDVDSHVFIKKALNENEKEKIRELHKSLEKKYPFIGDDLDCWYVLLQDVLDNVSLKHQVIEKDLYSDDWPLIKAHIFAGKYIPLYGPKLEKIISKPTWEEIDKGLQYSIDWIIKEEDIFNKYPCYGIINLFRIIYSYKYKDPVLSKAQAVEWGIKNFPEWEKHLELSRKCYLRTITKEEKAFLISEVKELFFNFGLEYIKKLKNEKI